MPLGPDKRASVRFSLPDSVMRSGTLADIGTD
jgi:hypothetical protein